ncbi:MAG: CGGC domain-containing protein [Syntrophobacteraceae bacterium]|nr:CGGC domain-containing protein [Syntrophobacteraceae bacterium]
MARIGIVTCSNCTQDTNCAAVVCLADMRKRQGFFERYRPHVALDLVGIINCAGCPTLAAPEKILRKVRAVAEFKLDALHFSYCMTALCPFLDMYKKAVKKEYPELEMVFGTHKPLEKKEFQAQVGELLCPSISVPRAMTDLIKEGR